MRTSLDAQANGWGTMLHQALPGPAGHFVAQCLRVWSRENENMLLETLAARELLPGGELSEQSW